ncbi:hypothetical protein ACFCZ1_27950 [Streptomyces sp. NPDC056224]|uniref:hypothetical protein n=1 Tax=Streptomyces sp. NPDC056224 TaxID=3345750 RepID=UPI0035D938FB
MPTQNRWRNCWKCQSLYYNGHGDGNRGVCPRDGEGHGVAGPDFTLTYNQAPSFLPSTYQNEWKNCRHCQVLFYAPNLGTCPSPYSEFGTHSSGSGFTYDFHLVHADIWDDTFKNQPNWRNCWNCQALYFDGFDDKGRCPIGGGHEGHGIDPAVYNFRLPYPMSPSIQLLQTGVRVVRVLGVGFTPEAKVKVDRAVHNLGGDYNYGNREVDSDRDGEFSTDLSWSGFAAWDRIDVGARDTGSDTVASSYLNP